MRKYNSLDEFYPYYLTEHSNSLCRVLHYIGTSCFLFLLVATFVFDNYWYLLLAPFSGYFFAWMGHFLFEKNKPATFKYPFFSLVSDFKLYFHFITGQVKKKLSEAIKQNDFSF